MLATASHRKLNSRLACQIRFDETFDGMAIRIAPEDATAFNSPRTVSNVDGVAANDPGKPLYGLELAHSPCTQRQDAG